MKDFVEDFVTSKLEFNKSKNSLFADYIYQIFLRFGTSEYSMMILFNSSLQAKLPLQRILVNYPNHITILMGEKDWMTKVDDDKGKEVLKDRARDEKYHIVSKAGHQMCFDNA